MKRILFALSLFVFVALSSCLKDPDDIKGVVLKGIPALSPTIVSDVEYSKAKMSSEVLSNPKWRYKIEQRGFVWSQKRNPSYTENEGKSTNGDGFGGFNYNVANLEPGKTYYIRSYAKSNSNIGYGEEKSFTTVQGIAPTVTISNVTDISYTTAKVSANVTNAGEMPVTERGFVWSTTSNPTYSSNLGKSSNGSGIGVFNNDLKDLTHNTTYYIRSYAKSEIGVGYSNEISFKTVQGIVPTVTIGNATNISYTTAKISGEVKASGSQYAVTERGFVWSTTSNPTYSSNLGKSSNGSGIGVFTNDITNLTDNTTYYIRSYAKSEIGVGYSDEISFKTIEDKSNILITVKGVSFNMKLAEGGTFQMGEEGIATPVHSVTLSDYYIGETEVTQALWEAVMGSNPSYFKGSNLPVERVSWDDCQEFINKLNTATGKKFRLPTEAEWEYAARGGNKSKGYKYSGSNTVGDVAWYDGNSSSKTHDVKTKAANELGIYDMSGNVFEWCQDWYGSYSSNAQTNPTGATSGSFRILRGGSWSNGESYCRVPYRDFNYPDYRYYSFGLRVALVQ